MLEYPQVIHKAWITGVFNILFLNPFIITENLDIARKNFIPRKTDFYKFIRFAQKEFVAFSFRLTEQGPVL